MNTFKKILLFVLLIILYSIGGYILSNFIFCSDKMLIEDKEMLMPFYHLYIILKALCVMLYLFSFVTFTITIIRKP